MCCVFFVAVEQLMILFKCWLFEVWGFNERIQTHFFHFWVDTHFEGCFARWMKVHVNWITAVFFCKNHSLVILENMDLHFFFSLKGTSEWDDMSSLSPYHFPLILSHSWKFYSLKWDAIISSWRSSLGWVCIILQSDLSPGGNPGQTEKDGKRSQKRKRESCMHSPKYCDTLLCERVYVSIIGGVKQRISAVGMMSLSDLFVCCHHYSLLRAAVRAF